MKARWLVAALVAALSVGFLAGTGFTEDPVPSEEEIQKMMDQMIQLGMPGEAHEFLKALEGDWDGVSRVYMSPGAEPTTTAATTRNTLFMGGRYLQSDYAGDYMGREFKGRGILGHDNHLKQYQSLWMDSWGSGMLIETGATSEDGKTLTVTGVWASPMGDMPMKHVYVLIGPDEYRLEGYSDHGAGEVKEMEVLFKRSKAAPVWNPCRPRHVPSKGPGY